MAKSWFTDWVLIILSHFSLIYLDCRSSLTRLVILLGFAWPVGMPESGFGMVTPSHWNSSTRLSTLAPFRQKRYRWTWKQWRNLKNDSWESQKRGLMTELLFSEPCFLVMFEFWWRNLSVQRVWLWVCLTYIVAWHILVLAVAKPSGTQRNLSHWFPCCF